MIRISLSFICLLIALVAHAQSASQIKASSEYLWGEGEGETLRLADDNAMVDLTSQIAVHVSGEKRTVVSNIQNGQNVKSQVGFEQIMKTYTSATLTNATRFVLADEPNAKVLRFIKKSDLDKIFEARKNKIKEMVNVASEALQNKQIDDAIRYYYWANMLLNSLRPTDDVKLIDAGHEVSAAIYISRQLNDIFENLKAEFKGKQKDGNIYEVYFTYKGSPVASLDYTYWMGNDWSYVNTARDGNGLIELKPGFSPRELRIKYECMYLDESHCDREVNQVLETVRQITYPNASVNVKVSDKELASQVNIESSVVARQQQSTTTAGASPAVDSGVALSSAKVAPHAKTIEKIVAAIKSRNYASVQSDFTSEGYKIFNKLINYGNARIIGNDMDIEFSELNGAIYCRSVPMRFSFSRNRNFVENVVFVFDSSGKIDNISFGLSRVAQDDVFSGNNDWSVTAKNVLVSFLENYKTAYALERIDYLESIFSDDALIISGKVVSKFTGNTEKGYSNNRYVELTKHSKGEYISRLRDIFNYNEFINIKFANNEVKKMGKGGEVYAVQIKQDYFSANYGDTGYLFLLVDVNDPEKPIIHVRAWQEQPDLTWGIIGPEHF